MPIKLPRFGDYPAEFNEKVHGPYDPARFYGKPDTPFGQVKVGELNAWLMRRNKHPAAVVGAVSRAFWRWQHKYMFPKYTSPAGLFQYMASLSLLFYIINISRIREHKLMKYHW